MSLSRFFLPAEGWPGEVGSVLLTGEEAHHCSRVLRKKKGDEVELFDGRGRVAQAVIQALSKEAVQVEILRVEIKSPLPFEVHLLPAMIKSEGFEWLLEKAVELGAASVRPVYTERSVVKLDAEQQAKKLLKWRRHMIESAKQCHTPFLCELHEPVTLREALPAVAAESGLKIMPSLSVSEPTLTQLLQAQAGCARKALVLIGPEGDFTPEEEALVVGAGFGAITLGPLVLRAETAVIASLAVISQTWLG